jgi:hypothetical protein
MFIDDGLNFLKRFPQCRPYHHPIWLELDAKDTETAPWGYQWYTTDADGKLQMHSAHYDSSG